MVSLTCGFMCDLELNALFYSNLSSFRPSSVCFFKFENLEAVNWSFKIMASPFLVHSLLG